LADAVLGPPAGTSARHDVSSPAGQGIAGVAAFGAPVGVELEAAGHLAVTEDVEDDRALLAPGLSRVDFTHSGLLEQAGTAHADLVPVHLGTHAQRRGGADVGARRDLRSLDRKSVV